MCASEITTDSLFHGNVQVLQKKDGYRFSIDSVILAHFPAFKKDDVILDLGCGCGVILLIISYRFPQVHLFGLELQEELFLLANRNITLNGLKERIKILRGDLKSPDQTFPASFADWVVCNPPYRAQSSGRINLEEEKALARHEIKASLLDVLEAAKFFLKPSGRLALIYPARRTAGLISAMRNTGLEPKRLQIVHSYPGGEGVFTLVEGRKDGGEELKILPPFLIYDQDRRYSPEMQSLYE